MAIFLLILFRTWRGCAKLIKQTADLPALQWIHNLARAFQVSLVAYGVAGAALNMAYFEMFYVFVVLVAIQEQMVKRHLAEAPRMDSLAPVREARAAPGPTVEDRPPLSLESGRARGTPGPGHHRRPIS